jgi:uncharacterized protein (TIGR02118 family)
MPMVRNLLGEAVKALSIDRGIGGETPGLPAPYAAVGHLYFDTVADFQNSFGPQAEKITYLITQIFNRWFKLAKYNYE